MPPSRTPPLSIRRHCWVLLPALGCTRTTQLGHTQHNVHKATLEDTGQRTAPAEPVPSTCLPGERSGFRIPSSRWALSVLFASRRLTQPHGNALQLSPSWFLASAWQSSSFSCGGYGQPWSTEAATDEGGCYALAAVTHWAELERLFPEQFPSDGWPDRVRGDRPEQASVALAQAAYAGHLLLRRVDGTHPDAWLEAAEDPEAAEQLAAFFHVEGPWSATAAHAWQSCADDLAACADGSLGHHLQGIAHKRASLSEADCYDLPIDTEELDAFIDGLQPMWPHADWPAVRAAAHAHHHDLGFTHTGLPIVRAIEDALDAPLACPEDTLWDHYRYSCY